MPRSFLRSLAGFYNDNDDGIASHRLTQPGGVHRSDRSDVGCTHAQACPLFPLLNESLRGWRDYYCDSDDRWCECARYKLAVTGQLVPISLLPNGKDAQHLRRAADADQSDVAEPRRAAPSRSRFWSPGTTARFEPAPPPTPPPGYEPLPQPARVPQPTETPSDPDESAAQRAHGRRRPWWSRLADWMRGPA